MYNVLTYCNSSMKLQDITFQLAGNKLTSKFKVFGNNETP